MSAVEWKVSQNQLFERMWGQIGKNLLESESVGIEFIVLKCENNLIVKIKSTKFLEVSQLVGVKIGKCQNDKVFKSESFKL